MGDEFSDKKKGKLNMDDWKLINIRDGPIQDNGCDCGVFTIALTDFKSDNLPLQYSHINMPYFRVKIPCDILRGKLEYPLLYVRPSSSV